MAKSSNSKRSSSTAGKTSSRSKSTASSARDALNKFKIEAASDEGVQNHLNTTKKSYFTIVFGFSKNVILVFNNLKI